MLTGTITVPASSGSTQNISYPSGLTADNSILISCGIKYSAIGINYVGKYDDSMDSYLNAFKRTVTLGPSNILLRIDNPMTEGSKTFSYKIVLMKIN